MFFDGLQPLSKKCCGCNSCVNICPKEAIVSTIDDEGFIIPQLNLDKCIDCGLCEKVCPMLHSNRAVSASEGVAYAAVNKQNLDLLKSSSGGIFSAIATYIISNGGIVYGAAFNKDMQLCHIGIEDLNSLKQLQGSKYLQSSLGRVFQEIRKHLERQRFVYFTGTGCQVAALKLFLQKEYENLITSDILCHGTPPQSVFNKTIEMLEEKYQGKVVNYLFRDKHYWGWSCSSSSSIASHNKIKYIGYDQIMDAYFNAFIKSVMYRESCYVCPYAQSHRAGDISLADYWGVENYINIPNIRDGVSAILINTIKGQNLIDCIKSNINLYPAKIANISVINKTLISPTPRPYERSDFFSKFKQNPIGTINSFAQPNAKRHFIYLLKRYPITAFLIKIFRH